MVALKLKPTASPNDEFGAREVAFVCNQESKYVVVIVAPSSGKFQNHQETVSVAVQRTENDFDSSDLLQRWDNEGDYIFAERPDELDKFKSYLKAQEADGIKSVNFCFPNDLEPISKSSEEDNEAGELDKAEEVLSVVLPADEYATLPLYPSEEALDEPAPLVTA